MIAVIGFIVLTVVIIIYYRVKNNVSEKHPKTCDICGEVSANTIALADGNVCNKCLNFPLINGEFQLSTYVKNKGGKNITVDELKNQIDSIKEMDQLLTQSSPTRMSPSGKIVVYDDLGLFILKDQAFIDFPHKISDIESFKLHIDRNFTESASDVVRVDGGHIEIKMNELFDVINFNLCLEEKFFGMKDYVKKTYEAELAFLEEITGKVRR